MTPESIKKDSAVQMREGDYFLWEFKQKVVKNRQDSVRAGTLYWCCARKAIVKNGRLCDIFWSTEGEGMSWTVEEAADLLDLTFLANKDDIEPTTHEKYYDKKDVIDLSHPNSLERGIYIRKDAQRSRAAMSSLLEDKIESAEYALSSAKRDLDNLRQKEIELKETWNLNLIYI